MAPELTLSQVRERLLYHKTILPPAIVSTPMRPDVAVTPPALEYPESDGKPVAETEVHVMALLHVVEVLRYHWRDAPQVYVGGNMLLYYEEGNIRAAVAPDVFVVRGVPKLPPRRTYKLWVEGRPPTVIFEFTSRSTKQEDLVTKMQLYAALGVSEYFLFDPLGEYLTPRLRGYQLVEGEYQPLRVVPLVSSALGLELRGEGTLLRLYDRTTGLRLPTFDEARALAERATAARRAAEARALREEARALREAEARRAAERRVMQEAQARYAAEQEVARLRAALAKLRNA